jgi:hypothetical protein
MRPFVFGSFGSLLAKSQTTESSAPELAEQQALADRLAVNRISLFAAGSATSAKSGHCWRLTNLT